jgi:hypothetical protein
MMREVAALPLLAIRRAIFSRQRRQQQLQWQKSLLRTFKNSYFMSKKEISNSILEVILRGTFYTLFLIYTSLQIA